MTSMRHVKTADVYRDGELAGQIERTDHGASFRYLPAFLERHGAGAAIAFRLPPSREPVVTHGANLHPFFAGLLPEGQRFVALSRRVKTSRDDLLTLLMAAGADCIGDVSVTPHDAPPRDVSVVWRSSTSRRSSRRASPSRAWTSSERRRSRGCSARSQRR